MSSSLKPIVLYSHASGPNPWKVAIVLEELGLPYEARMMEFPDLKKAPYESICVNGRVPAIEDPNTGIILWESAAINEYLVETYDKEHKLTYTTSPEKFHIKQWTYFQMSGQGPYYGQAAWFNRHHPERIESATLRYKNEMLRVFGVLNRALEGKEYLVGDKYTLADLIFVPWDMLIAAILGDAFPDLDIETTYPNFFKWHNRMLERPAVKKIVADKLAAKVNGH